jgi:ABC-type transport system involved in multi-copper enzyme maturation permease subunit
MMFVNAFQMELTKIRHRTMTRVLFGMLALFVAGMYMVLYVVLQSSLSDPGASPGTIESLRSILSWPHSFSTLLGLVSGGALGGMLLIILTGAMTAQEYTWRTAHLWLSRGLPRSTFLLGKYAALAVVALLVVLTPLLVGTPLTAWTTHQLTGSLSLDGLDVAQLALSILRTAYTLLPYIALTVLVAVLTRSTAAAIAVGLAYTLLVESILVQILSLGGGIWAKMAAYVPGSLAEALLQANHSMLRVDLQGSTGAALTGGWAAALGLTLYTAAFLGLALLAFRRQNLTG